MLLTHLILPCRYLVKKNLDGYVPIQQRPGSGSRSPKAIKVKTKLGPGLSGAGLMKPKRMVLKR
jgi:hypothetical protein